MRFQKCTNGFCLTSALTEKQPFSHATSKKHTTARSRGAYRSTVALCRIPPTSLELISFCSRLTCIPVCRHRRFAAGRWAWVGGVRGGVARWDWTGLGWYELNVVGDAATDHDGDATREARRATLHG